MKKVKCPKCKKIIGIDVDTYWSSLQLGISFTSISIFFFVLGYILN